MQVFMNVLHHQGLKMQCVVISSQHKYFHRILAVLYVIIYK